MRFAAIRKLPQQLGRLVRHEQVVLNTLAVVMGLVGGGAAIAFREGIALVQYGFYGFSSERFHSQVAEFPWWHIVGATTLGGLAAGLLVYWIMPNRRTQGVADAIEASALHGGRMSLRGGLGAATVSAVTIGSGGSAGREGPVVHLAASLGAFVAERLRLGRSLTQTVLGCGVAAGVAASFNAPIAGVFFALEVVTGNYALATFAPVVIASVTGTIVSRIHFGDYPAFIIPPNEIVSFWEFPAFALLGVASAVAAIAFVWSVSVVQGVTERFARVPLWLRPAVGGLLVGLIGIQFPQILGVGYEGTDQALNEELTLAMLLILVVLKTAATAITLGTGGGGGVFSPSLFIGAMLGGAFGIVATEVFPHLSSGHGAYTLVGMGAVAGAVLGAPISTILIAFELTGDYQLTVAVMIATVIASQIMQHAYGHSFFSYQLERRGISLRGGREATALRSRLVRDVMQHDLLTIRPGASMQEVREKLTRTPYGVLFAVDDDERLLGTVRLIDLADSAFNTESDRLLKAIDVMRMKPPVASVDDDLEAALRLIQRCGEEHVAVVDGDGSGRLLGVLHERDLLAAYHRTVLETRGS